MTIRRMFNELLSSALPRSLLHGPCDTWSRAVALYARSTSVALQPAWPTVRRTPAALASDLTACLITCVCVRVCAGLPPLRLSVCVQ